MYLMMMVHLALFVRVGEHLAISLHVVEDVPIVWVEILVVMQMLLWAGSRLSKLLGVHHRCTKTYRTH